MLSAGAKIKATLITEEFSCEDYHQQYHQRAVQLFAVHPDGRVEVANANDRLEVDAGWLVLALVAEEKVADLAPKNA
jgi:hypothetical protein